MHLEVESSVLYNPYLKTKSQFKEFTSRGFFIEFQPASDQEGFANRRCLRSFEWPGRSNEIPEQEKKSIFFVIM